MVEKNYIGKIGNSGTQSVKGPYADNGKKGKRAVKQGDDLRSGKK